MERKTRSRQLQQKMVEDYVKQAQEIYPQFDKDKHLTLLETLLDNALKKLNRAEELHEDILEEIDEVADMTKAEKDFSTFRITNQNELLILRNFIQKHSNTQESLPDLPVGSSSASHNGSSMKLPKMYMKKFNGDPLNWKTFYDTFIHTIDKRTDLANIEKMSYLMSLMEGEAELTLKGFALTDNNYKEALETLNRRFGDEQIIITSHMNKLLALPAAESLDDTKSIRSVYDTVEAQIRSLTAFGLDIENYGAFLVPVIMSKIPNEIKLIITRSMEKWDAKAILQILHKEISAREKIDLTSSVENESKLDLPTGHNLFAGGKTDRNKLPSCAFCNGKHKSQQCRTVKTVAQRKERIRKNGMCFLCLKKGHTVRDCRERFKCFKCNGKHHSAICVKSPEKDIESKDNPDNPTENKETASSTTKTSTTTFIGDGNNVLLQTARAKVSSTNERKCENLRILFDSGSQHSYISPAARQRLDLEKLNSTDMNVNVFGGGGNVKKMDCVKFAVKSSNGGKSIYVNAFVNEICKPLSGQTIELAVERFDHLKGLRLADSNPENLPLKIDILIGSDFYHQFFTHKTVSGMEGPVAQESLLGYILSGPIYMNSCFSGVVSTHSLFVTESPEVELNKTVQKFWDLESIGILPDEKDFTEEFREKIQFVDDRYEVELPFKDNVSSLANNYITAENRLKSLWRKFGKDSELYHDYKQIIYEQENLEIIEKLSETSQGDGLHYLPHRAVVRDDKITTKTRLVFDASSKGRNEFSLNETLCTGPSLTPSLFGVLIRFRTFNYVVIGDVEKAFHQISIKPEDRDYVRFLWFKDPENIDFENFENNQLIEYKICRLLMGATCSPFVLNSVMMEHIEKNSENPEFAKKVLESLHVDDLNSGENTKEEAIEFYNKTKDCLQKANFNLRKFQSNSKEIEQEINDFELEATKKVLGVGWNKETDELYFDFKALVQGRGKPTKRNVMKFLASIYDPLGLVNPIVVRLKILFQTLCIENFGWDSEITGYYLNQWNTILDEFENSECITFPRLYANVTEDVKSVQLHVFNDASERAYGTCAYLRYSYKSGEVKTALVTAKSRVAPIKKKSMPRLELLANLLGSRLLETLKTDLKNVLSLEKEFLWTDNSIAYAWIINTHKEYKKWVQKRAQEIRKRTVSSNWKLIASEDNPGDITTRGKTIKELNESLLWRHGPAFLLLDEAEWPNLKIGDKFRDEELKEEVKEKTQTCSLISVVKTSLRNIIDVNSFSCIHKLLRITAYVLRFVRKLKQKRLSKKEEEDTLDIEINKKLSKKEEDTTATEKLLNNKKMGLGAEENTLGLGAEEGHGPEETTLGLGAEEGHGPEENTLWLGAEELSIALRYWIINEQNDIDIGKNFNVFVDALGQIRCKGRMKNLNTSFDSKYPLLLDTKSKLTELLVLDAHLKTKHGGVRDTLTFMQNRFHIRKGRNFVRKLIHRCLICRKFEGGTMKYPSPPDLPKERLDDTRAFNSVGLDYCGPFYVKEIFNKDLPTNKCWIALITCASTRSICLDIAKDYSAETCIEILRRFSSRRGTPESVTSDNGSNFTANETQQFAAGRGITWKFNLEAAPWQGGFFERLVGIVVVVVVCCSPLISANYNNHHNSRDTGSRRS